MHYIDHIILGVSDLDAGIMQFEELTGVRAVRGGEHPGLGTHNALVSLGNRTYLEILAPRPDTEVVDWLQFLGGLDEIEPVMWVIGTEDIRQTAERLAATGFDMAASTSGSRTAGDGSILRWNMMRPVDSALAASLFFIEWDRASIHPSDSSPKGCTLESFEIQDSRADELRRLVETLGLGVVVNSGLTHGIKLSLRYSRGEITLNPD